MELATSADSTGDERENSPRRPQGVWHRARLFARRAKWEAGRACRFEGENMDRQFYLHQLSRHMSCPKRPDERASSAVHRRERSAAGFDYCRSEEHTSELQSQSNLVCRLLLEKK